MPPGFAVWTISIFFFGLASKYFLTACEVGLDVIEQEGVEDLAEHERRAGRLHLGDGSTPLTSRDRPTAKRASRRGGAPARSECSGGRRRRVELAADADVREEEGDGGRRERVRRADQRAAHDGARRRGRGHVPSGPVCMKMTVRPEATSVAETLSAERWPRRSVRAIARQGISRSMSFAIGRTSKSPTVCSPPPQQDAVHAERLAEAEAEHVGEVQRRPEIDQTAHALGRVLEVRGEVARVDRADGRAAEDVEARRRAAEASERVEDVREDADLVGAARAAAGEDDRYLLAASALVGTRGMS